MLKILTVLSLTNMRQGECKEHSAKVEALRYAHMSGHSLLKVCDSALNNRCSHIGLSEHNQLYE